MKSTIYTGKNCNRTWTLRSHPILILGAIFAYIYELFMDSDSGRLEHVAATRRADGCPKGGEANALYKNLGEGPLVCAAPPILHVPQTGEEWRWTLGCERHALSNTNRNMGGVDPSDQLKRYYSAHRNRAH